MWARAKVKIWFFSKFSLLYHSFSVWIFCYGNGNHKNKKLCFYLNSSGSTSLAYVQPDVFKREHDKWHCEAIGSKPWPSGSFYMIDKQVLSNLKVLKVFHSSLWIRFYIWQGWGIECKCFDCVTRSNIQNDMFQSKSVHVDQKWFV